MRKFYQVYSPAIQQTLSAKTQIGQTPSALSEKNNSLMNLFDEPTQIGQTPSAQFKLTLVTLPNFNARRKRG